MPKKKSSAQQSKQITADDSLWLDSFCRETTSLSETLSDPLWKKEWIREISHLINPPQSPMKPAVRKKKQTGNQAIERAVTLEPLSGEGFQSVVFPWPSKPRSTSDAALCGSARLRIVMPNESATRSKNSSSSVGSTRR